VQPSIAHIEDRPGISGKREWMDIDTCIRDSIDQIYQGMTTFMHDEMKEGQWEQYQE
jgi:hypothetical protein